MTELDRMMKRTHFITPEIIEQEKFYCQGELVSMYNADILTADELASRFDSLRDRIKEMYDLSCDLYNLTE